MEFNVEVPMSGSKNYLGHLTYILVWWLERSMSGSKNYLDLSTNLYFGLVARKVCSRLSILIQMFLEF